MQKILFACLSILFLPVRSVCTEVTVVASPQNEAERKLIERIQQGDSGAITEAGKSQNTAFIPYLTRELKNSKPGGIGGDRVFVLRLALAKLGDVEQLQTFWCESLSEDPNKGLHPARIFDSIGGWYSIRALQFFLTPDGEIHWKKAYSRFGGKYGNDVLQTPPSFEALQILPKLVPNPPTGPLSSESASRPADLINTWQDWIAAHKDELSKLQPTGEGVDFSPRACKNGRPRKK